MAEMSSPGGVFLRVIGRMRSGYANFGNSTPFGAESRCPYCGALDTIEHLLLHCISLHSERCILFKELSSITKMSPSLPLLLGFASLSSSSLRRITIATARFVCSARRRI